MFIEVTSEDIEAWIVNYFKEEYQDHTLLKYITNLIDTRGSAYTFLKALNPKSIRFKPGDAIKIKINEFGVGNQKPVSLNLDWEQNITKGIIVNNSIYFTITDYALGHYDYVYKGYIKYITTERDSDDNYNSFEKISEIFIKIDDIYDYNSMILDPKESNNKIVDRF